MGRALFSQKYLSEPAVCEDPAPPFGVPCRRWSPCNQFDPDSEDFFKNAQLEQFLDGLFDNSVWTLQRRNPQNSAALDNVNDSASSTTTSAGDDDESLSDPIDDDKSLSDSDEDDSDDSDDSDESLSNSNHHDETLSDDDDDDSDDSDETLSDSNDSPMAIGTDDPASLLDVYVPADFAQDEPRRQSHSTRSTRHPSSLRHPEDSLISHQTSYPLRTVLPPLRQLFLQHRRTQTLSKLQAPPGLPSLVVPSTSPLSTSLLHFQLLPRLPLQPLRPLILTIPPTS